MALYALAGGFLNAYNRSEAAKKQAAAEREEIARQIAREDDVYERARRHKEADDKVANENKKIDQDLTRQRIKNQENFNTESLNIKKQQLTATKRKVATDAVLDLFKTRMNAYSRGLTNEDPKIARTSQSSLNKLSKQYDILIASIARGEPINLKSYLNIANSIQSDLENNVAKERVGELGIDTGVGDLETFENTNDSFQTGFDKDNPSVVLGVN